MLLVACGEMVRPALDAVALLKEQGISAGLLDMYCVKPLDKEAIVDAAGEGEGCDQRGGACALRRPWFHGEPGGGRLPRRVINMALPDAPVISGTSREVFDY